MARYWAQRLQREPVTAPLLRPALARPAAGPVAAGPKARSRLALAPVAATAKQLALAMKQVTKAPEKATLPAMMEPAMMAAAGSERHLRTAW
jgi:hypothetical protein